MRSIRTLALATLGSLGLCLITTGCAAERNQDVPASAKLVAQGEKDLAYRAADPGTVYIFDKSGQNVLYSGKVERDDLVKVDAMHDKITMNDRVVMDKQIRDHDAINIFFEPDRSARLDAREASDRTVIREREIRTVIREREIRTEPRTDSSSITVRPEGDKVTVQGSGDSKVTVEPKQSDSKVTIEKSDSQR